MFLQRLLSSRQGHTVKNSLGRKEYSQERKNMPSSLGIGIDNRKKTPSMILEAQNYTC